MTEKNERNEKLLKMAREGYNRSEIAEMFGITKERVRQLCNKYNAPPAPRLRKAISESLKIAEQYRGILSPVEISKIAGINPGILSSHGFRKIYNPNPTEKKCKRCGIIKSISEFTTDPRGHRMDKHCPHCKECEAIRHREMYKKNPEKLKASVKKWGNKNKEKIRAHASVHRALSKGLLSKPELCELCHLEKRLVAHHWHGYDKEHRLDVQWICQSCHNGLRI
jgi:hypothetical protein